MVWFYFDSWTCKLLTFETSTKLSLSFKGAPGVSGERGEQGKPGRTVSLWSSDGERFTRSTQMLPGALHLAKQKERQLQSGREFSGRNGKELKQRRRRRQRERQKSNRFRSAEQQLCTCITLFCTFLCRRCTTTTWKCLNSRFVEGGNTTFFFFSWTLIQCYRIQL